MTTTNTFDFENAENLVLNRTGPVIVEQPHGFMLGEFRNPVATVIERVMNMPDDPTARHHWVPAYADLYNRGIIDFRQESIGDNESNASLFANLNEIEECAGQIAYSEGTALSLAFLAFSGVLMRPKDLDISDNNRKLHRVEVKSGRDEPHLAEVYRHRRNLLFTLANGANLRDRDQRYLRPFTVNGKLLINNENVTKKLPELDPVSDKKSVEIVNGLYVADYAKRLLKLFRTGIDTAEELRTRFIERGFKILGDLDVEHVIGEDLFYADITEAQERHILEGDKNGGGHHLPSLNRDFKRIVSEEVEVPSSIDPEVKIPVAMASRVINGVNQKPELHSFFPSEWSPEQVISSIKQPGRVIFERERNGRLTQYCHTRGMVIKRIIGLYEDSTDEEVVTAFPEVNIPVELRQKLAA